MGRTENPIDYELPGRGRLAELLRGERARAGRTYDELATLTGVSAATLKRAASGKVTPKESVVEAFLGACESGSRTITLAKNMRRQARRDERGGHTRVLAVTVNAPDTLSDALIALHRNYGAPPYREMQERAGGAFQLPLSSISRILQRQMLPVDEQQMAAFLQGCRVPGPEQEEWLQAWRRAMRSTTPGFYTPKVVEELIHQTLGAAPRELDSRQAAIRRRLDRMDKPKLSGSVTEAEILLRTVSDRIVHRDWRHGRATAMAEQPVA
ncbi:helix-turn-helix domain-containing protein [Streptomyces sp. NPDC012438]|uniref:helix-turn-helix domain-containing protein n=1 Tax=Streptomyces sp. NPDC012438 TaxID=3364833 RepID=UPI0036E4F4BC